jgi:uncharacterized glyoxalase superfamily protein PhnB
LESVSSAPVGASSRRRAAPRLLLQHFRGSAKFGFVERVQIGENHRSQLSFGDGAVIVGDVRHDRRPPRHDEETHSVVVRVDDANAHCERARAHGAQILMEPTDFEYGERQYAAEDPAGHRWIFSETLRDVAPEEWGGTTRDAPW